MFQDLPSHNIHYPIGHFPVIPPRPVVPTAALAALIGKDLTTLGENLSPAAKQQRELEIGLLGYHVAKAKSDSELAQRQVDDARQKAADDAKGRADQNKADEAIKKSMDDNSPAPNVPTSLYNPTQKLNPYAMSQPHTSASSYWDNQNAGSDIPVDTTSLPDATTPESTDQSPDESPEVTGDVSELT